MTDERLQKLATLIRLWTSQLNGARSYSIAMPLTTEYFQGKLDATWKVIDILLSEEEIQKIEALTGEKR